MSGKMRNKLMRIHVNSYQGRFVIGDKRPSYKTNGSEFISPLCGICPLSPSEILEIVPEYYWTRRIICAEVDVYLRNLVERSKKKIV